MKPEFSKPEIHEKIWGKEIWIHNSNQYCGKILDFKANHYSSSHFHILKTETWFILSGHLILEYIENGIKKDKTLLPNEIVHITPGTIHKITAIEDSKIIEVSTQHIESDSIRIIPSGKLEDKS